MARCDGVLGHFRALGHLGNYAHAIHCVGPELSECFRCACVSSQFMAFCVTFVYFSNFAEGVFYWSWGCKQSESMCRL